MTVSILPKLCSCWETHTKWLPLWPGRSCLWFPTTHWSKGKVLEARWRGQGSSTRLASGWAVGSRTFQDAIFPLGWTKLQSSGNKSAHSRWDNTCHRQPGLRSQESGTWVRAMLKPKACQRQKACRRLRAPQATEGPPLERCVCERLCSGWGAVTWPFTARYLERWARGRFQIFKNTECNSGLYVLSAEDQVSLPTLQTRPWCPGGWPLQPRLPWVHRGWKSGGRGQVCLPVPFLARRPLLGSNNCSSFLAFTLGVAMAPCRGWHNPW